MNEKGPDQPLVSFIIPTLNEAGYMERCLRAVLAQERPGLPLEVLVADGGSTDGTREIVTRYGEETGGKVALVDNPDRIAEFGNARALERMRGSFMVLFAPDNDIPGKDWLARMLEAFDVFPDILGAESHYLPKKGEPAINRYLTGCLHISDPLAHGIAARPRLLEAVSRNGATFRRFTLPPGYPCGANGFVYRFDRIRQFVGARTFEEAHVLMEMAREGNATLAMIDGVGVRHDYADSFRTFLRKRFKIALKHTTRSAERETWVDYTGWRRYAVPVLYATAVFPFVTSLFAAIRDREPHWLLHGPMSFITAWVYIASALYIRITGKRAW